MSSSSVTPPVLPTTIEPYRRLALRLTSPNTDTSQSSTVSLLEDIKDVCLTQSITEQDYIIESEMQRLTEKIVKYIKKNRDLNGRIDKIDGNIGLIIRNSRLTLSKEALAEMKYIVNHNSKSRRNRCGANGNNTIGGEFRKWISFDIGRFNQSHCTRLKCYSHLFYALQTQPRYLSRLLFAVPTFQVSSFFKNCIYSLFFCDPGEREIYLLCKLLQEALKEEVTHKITKASYIIDGDPMIITIALDCHRARRQVLFDLLQPVILDIVSLKEPFLCLDPISLYKDHYDLTGTHLVEEKIQQDISIEQALNDNQVRAQLAHNIPLIVKTCTRLIDTIVSPEFLDLIPFGLKYICKSLDSSLVEKLNSLNEPYGEEDKIKVISNIIFTRWIRPCILFPEAYLTSMRENEKRTSLISRRNLNGVYKILQAAVTGKRTFTFSPMVPQSSVGIEETKQLDTFLGQSWFQLKTLVDSICCVEEISDIFFFNEFADEANLKPPTITVTFQEIIEFHSILHRYQNDIAPNETDPIDVEFHKLMEECGPPHQDIQSLLGCDPNYVESVGSDELINTEISLPLSCRVIKDVEVKSKATIKVKQALLELIRQRINCKDLNQLLFRKLEEEENKNYIVYKNSINWCLPQDLKKHSVILVPQTGAGLCSLLDFAIQNMRYTEARSFDEIISMITNDIIYKLQYRSKQYAKMINLEETLNTMVAKREHLQEIYSYYEKYLNKCKANYQLSPALEKVAASSPASSSNLNETRYCLRYNAAKLKSKGIIISIGDVKSSKLKYIKFEFISSLESTLTIRVRMFLNEGIELGYAKLDFLNLLKLQYDGDKVFNPFGRVHINLNPFLYLLNSKLYLRKN